MARYLGTTSMERYAEQLIYAIRKSDREPTIPGICQEMVRLHYADMAALGWRMMPRDARIVPQARVEYHAAYDAAPEPVEEEG